MRTRTALAVLATTVGLGFAGSGAGIAQEAAPDAAAQLLAIGESKPDTTLAPADLAAWTTIASMILNLDEAINR